MKKILLSLAIIVAGATMVTGATMSYFSDTETSTGNTFTAGTIDISINDQNPWNDTFVLADMKPCYTDYINFRIDNDRSDPNPVNIFKDINVTLEETGTVSEPECTEQGGTWDENNVPKCNFGSNSDQNNLSDYIWYDLYVEVYNVDGYKIWDQTIYVDGDEASINAVYVDGQIFLGMIPMGGYMLVEQSYHLAPTVENWAQGDEMTFDIVVKGEQLYGTAWLENKDESKGWKLILNDNFKGTLNYIVKNPTFEFEFIGKAPLANHKYYLIAGENTGPNPYKWDPDVELGTATSLANGDITITGDVELGADMKDAKVWLVPEGEWDGTKVTWIGYPGSVANYLFETGLIWYEDTDL